MKYPGHVVKQGETDTALVRALKRKLNEALALGDDPKARLDPENPHFGPKMRQTVKLFQARNVDQEGRPLKQDGEIGAHTWAALFGAAEVPVHRTTSDGFMVEVLRIAAGEEAKKVREVPRNSNRGPEVDAYLQCAGVPTGNPWCCAFVYWCFNEAAGTLGRGNPVVRTGGCLDHWKRAESKGATRIPQQRAIDDPGLVEPGAIFIIDHGRGLGHTGLVESVSGGFMKTIEGNTDASRTREGGGVYRLTRKINEINKGFLDYRRC